MRIRISELKRLLHEAEAIKALHANDTNGVIEIVERGHGTCQVMLQSAYGECNDFNVGLFNVLVN